MSIQEIHWGRFQQLVCCLWILACFFTVEVSAQSPDAALASATEQRSAAEEKLTTLKTEVLALENELSEQQKILRQAESSVKELRDTDELIQASQNQIDGISGLQTRLAAKQELNDDDKSAWASVFGKEAKVEATPAANKILSAAISHWQSELQRLQAIKADAQREQKLADAQQELQQATESAKKLQTQLEPQQQELAEQSEALNKLRKAESRASLTIIVAQAKAKHAAAAQALQDSDASLKEKLDGLNEALLELQKAGENTKARRQLPAPLDPVLKLIQTAIDAQKEADAAQAPVEAARQSLAASSQILDTVDRALKNMDSVVREKNGKGHYVGNRGAGGLNEFVTSLNDLADADQSLGDGLTEAEQASQNESKAVEQLAAVQRQQTQQGDQPIQPNPGVLPFSFVPNSHQYFSSPSGQQQLAMLDQFAKSDDLKSLRAFRDTLNEENGSNAEQALVGGIADAIIVQTEFLSEWLYQTHVVAQEAVTPAMSAAAVAGQINSLSGVPTTPFAGLPVDTESFRCDVFAFFNGSLLRAVERRIARERNLPKLPGGNVVKGTSKIADIDGKQPEVVVTVSFSLFGDGGEETGETTTTTRTDEEGGFEVQIPEDAEPQEVKVAGRGIAELAPLDAKLFTFADVQQTSVVAAGVLDRLGDCTRIPPGRFGGGIDTTVFRDPEDEPDSEDDGFQEQSTSILLDSLDLGDDQPNNEPPNEDNQWEYEGSDLNPQPRQRSVAVSVELNNDDIADDIANELATQIKNLVGDDGEVDIEQKPPVDAPNPDDDYNLFEDPQADTPNEPQSTLHIFTIATSPILNDDDLQKALDETIEKIPGINWGEIDLPRIGEGVAPQDPNFTRVGSWGQGYADQWALHRVGGEPEQPVWPEKIPESEVCTVAVIGSGIDWTHPELMGQMWRNMDEIPGNGIDDDENGYIDDNWGWNFRDDNQHVLDQGGHDTHVAGVIAARWDEYGIAGVNPRTRIMALKAANQLAQSDSISISRAIMYAADNGARVINVSYGGPVPSKTEQTAINYAVSKGALVIVAAGNKSEDASEYALAGAAGVLTVAGTTVEDERAPFSNYGQPIDIAAPAMDVLGIRARGTDFLLYIAENPEYVGGTGFVGSRSDLYRASGTSFAAPFVSGAASLLFSNETTLTNRDVGRKLLSSVVDLEVAGVDQYTGFGLVDMSQALIALPNDFLAVVITKVAPVRTDSAIVIQVNGRVSGARLEERQLFVGFGEDPADEDWQLVSTDHDRVRGDDVLGQIPVRFFTKRGKWSIRVVAKTISGKTHEARASIDIN